MKRRKRGKGEAFVKALVSAVRYFIRKRERYLCKKPVDRGYGDIISRADSILERELLFLDSNLSIDAMSRKVGTNRTYLSNSIKQMRNQSFTDYINAKRVEYAKRMIGDQTVCKGRDGGKFGSSIEDFATASGFGSKRSFVRCFKEREGVTPSQYRNHMSSHFSP
ncbi:MAG: helix-turn-helix domain-containing protein [Bacteroidales bacterium]|nr:helix-turn-helix domain-containing protein [Bacteroidales bacterium]